VLAGKLSRIPKVLMSVRALNLSFSPMKLRLMRWVEQLCDHITAVSESVAESLTRRENLDKKMITVIYNGVQLETVSWKKATDWSPGTIIPLRL
jgi:hypothetical protein